MATINTVNSVLELTNQGYKKMKGLTKEGFEIYKKVTITPTALERNGHEVSDTIRTSFAKVKDGQIMGYAERNTQKEEFVNPFFDFYGPGRSVHHQTKFARFDEKGDCCFEHNATANKRISVRSKNTTFQVTTKNYEDNKAVTEYNVDYDKTSHVQRANFSTLKPPYQNVVNTYKEATAPKFVSIEDAKTKGLFDTEG